MVFDHIVKYNGTYYAAGEDVPMGQETKKSSAPFVSSKTDDVPKEETKRRGRPAKKEQ